MPPSAHPGGEAPGATVSIAPALAKINLYLHVVGRRADGYHLLDSLVAFAADGDRVVAHPHATLTLLVEGPFAEALANEPDNLVLRAARALAAETNTAQGAAFTLYKNLPVASGIGGGSADAAAALTALSGVWHLPHDFEMLQKVARQLGADVPVCLYRRPAFLGGIGEELEPAPALPAAGLVLVNPGIPLSTPTVFAQRSGPFSQPSRFAAAPRDAAALAAVLRERRNDLTEAAVALVPAIRDVLAALEGSRHCLLARMSGSGATCFGLYADRDAAERAAAALAAKAPGWWVLPTSLLAE